MRAIVNEAWIEGTQGLANMLFEEEARAEIFVKGLGQLCYKAAAIALKNHPRRLSFVNLAGGE